MKVSEWFWGWAAAHALRTARTDFPEPGTPEGDAYWTNVLRAFVRHGVTLLEADEASSMVAEKSLFPSDQLPALLEAARWVREAAPPPPGGPDASDIDSARSASRECPHCSGNGWASFLGAEIWGEAEGDRRAKLRFSLWCTCPLGRWMKRANDALPADRQAKVRALADYPHLMVAADTQGVTVAG